MFILIRNIVVSMGVLAAIVAPVRADLVNGGFEQPSMNGSGYVEFVAGGSATLPGWTVESGSVDVVTSGYLGHDSSEGHQWLDLNGDDAGTISQIMQASMGSSYSLSFDFSGYHDGDGFESSAGKGIIYQLFDGSTGATLAQGSLIVQQANLDVWSTVTLQAMATSTLLGVRFESDGDPSDPYVGPTLDAVSLTLSTPSVPEPTSACLTLIAGMVSLAAYRFRRRPA